MPAVKELLNQATALFHKLDALPLDRRIEAINRLRKCLSDHSPFSDEPIDCIQWIPADEVQGNDYNPNTVAPPEMKLLELSINEDGYTQPIVVHEQQERDYVVVDGFHRQQIGKKAGPIRKRLHGYLPVVCIRASQGNLVNRIAATIRHNRARGVHAVMPMKDVVVTLLETGWTDREVVRRLGMDADEVLRFKQVSGLPHLFRDSDYSKSWE